MRRTVDRERVERHASHLRKLAGLERIELLPPGETVKGAATALLGAMRILVPLAGLIDVAAERERLGKQLAKTRDDLGKVRRKLENQSFVANAPADVVAKEHARVAELEQRATQLEQQLARLAELTLAPPLGLRVADRRPWPSARHGTPQFRHSRLPGASAATSPHGTMRRRAPTAQRAASEPRARTRFTNAGNRGVAAARFRRRFAGWLHLH